METSWRDVCDITRRGRDSFLLRAFRFETGCDAKNFQRVRGIQTSRPRVPAEFLQLNFTGTVRFDFLGSSHKRRCTLTASLHVVLFVSCQRVTFRGCDVQEFRIFRKQQLNLFFWRQDKVAALRASFRGGSRWA